MECKICDVKKLPNEFAPENVTENCEHPTLYCLRCTIKAVKDTSKCPHATCDQTAKLSDAKLQWFQTILDDLFKEYTTEDSDFQEVENTAYAAIGHGAITITVLTGESMSVPFDPHLTVTQLKRKVQATLKHEIGKQKILYNDKELTDYKVEGGVARLSDFAVKPNSVLYLVVLLFSVPEHFNHVVFDLHWGYPVNGRDYLDASCLMFQGTEFHKLSDYYHTQPLYAVCHSGDMMDDKKRIGHHTIHVKLKELPDYITHLFFTLSAWRCPNISRYPNPSLKFYEAYNPTKDLCKTTFHHAGHSQAVVMCSVSRGPNGRWQIFESGKLSAGNARKYGPIKETLRSLIVQGY